MPRDQQDGYKDPPRTPPGTGAPCGISEAASQPHNTLTAGAKITVTWDETVTHPGCFVIDFSPANDANFTILGVKSHMNAPAPTNPSSSNRRHWSLDVTLPSTPCPKCTLRLRQLMLNSDVTADKCPPATIPTASTYYSCSNVALTGGTTGTGGTGGSGTGGSGAGGGSAGAAGRGGSSGAAGTTGAAGAVSAGGSGGDAGVAGAAGSVTASGRGGDVGGPAGSGVDPTGAAGSTVNPSGAAGSGAPAGTAGSTANPSGAAGQAGGRPPEEESTGICTTAGGSSPGASSLLLLLGLLVSARRRRRSRS